MFTFLLFDVGHGFCAYATTPGGGTILFDCGYDDDLQFHPSRYFRDRGITTISQLVLSHFDQDHVCDLPNVREIVTFGSIIRNKTIPVDFIEAVKRKEGLITTAMASALDMHRHWTAPVLVAPNYGGVNLTIFNNSYPDFTDTNNLSVVAFLEYEGCGIVIPGDLKAAGWERLLKNSAFCECLKRTTIFIASHHGRDNGYCEAVFNYCKPHVIILSDKNKIHDSQDHDYTKHASGTTGEGQKRFVYTTRNDGHILITKQPNDLITYVAPHTQL